MQRAFRGLHEFSFVLCDYIYDFIRLIFDPQYSVWFAWVILAHTQSNSTTKQVYLSVCTTPLLVTLSKLFIIQWSSTKICRKHVAT